jgi:hypothetical protein
VAVYLTDPPEQGMSTNASRGQEGSKRRVVRRLWLALGLALLAAVGAWSAVEISDLMQNGHPLRGALLAGVTVLLLMLGLLVTQAQWHDKQPKSRRRVLPPDAAAEQTGVWGVGGPSMREPGNTGNWQVRKVDRRYENTQD